MARSNGLWVTAAVFAGGALFTGGVLAADDERRRPARAAQNGDALQLKQVTIDKRGMVRPDKWNPVTESNAIWDTEGFRGEYSWSIPSSIPPAGAVATLTVIATDKTGGRYNGKLDLTGNIRVEGGPAEAQALADKNGGQGTKRGDASFKLVPGSYCDTCAIAVTVNVQDGPKVTFHYKVVPKPNPCATVSRLAHTAAADCAPKTATEPAPGGSSRVSSPTIAPGASKLGVTVTSSSGELTGTTIVGEGERSRSTATGEAVAACWLIGPEALDISDPDLKAEVLKEIKPLFELNAGDPERVLRLCIALVAKIGTGAEPRPVRAHAAASSCRAQRLGIAMRLRRGRIRSARPIVSRRIPSKAVRYKCAVGANGAVRITADGRRRGGLRKKVGRKLELGVVRARNAPAARGTLTFGFGG
jgi:hypothetical protein